LIILFDRRMVTGWPDPGKRPRSQEASSNAHEPGSAALQPGLDGPPGTPRRALAGLRA